MCTIIGDVHFYSNRQSYHLHHGITSTTKARQCNRYLLHTLIDNTSQAILEKVETNSIDWFSFYVKIIQMTIMQAFAKQGIVTYTKKIIDNIEWCNLLVNPLCKRSLIPRSRDANIVKSSIVLASGQRLINMSSISIIPISKSFKIISHHPIIINLLLYKILTSDQ